VPAFPLDGGRVLRSLLWRRGGDVRQATQTAAGVGRLFGYTMIFLGGLAFLGGAPEGLWLALIGFFIVMAAGQQAMGAEIQAALSGVSARELMSSPVVCIPERTSVTSAGSEYFVPYRYTAFPVVDGSGRAVGLVSLAQIEALARRRETEQEVCAVCERAPGLIVGEEEDVAALLERPDFGRVGRAVVVDGSRRPVGLISITDVQRVLRASQLARTSADARVHAG